MKLSSSQRKVYDYLLTYQREHGYPPAIREIGAAMNLKSSSTVHFHLRNLEKLGLITVEPGKGRAITLREQPEADAKTGIPVVGTVAAGSPILAQECVEDYLALGSVGEGGGYFALRVRGESMIKAGILPGDYVIVRQQPEANNGEIVVALIGDEATVKRYALRDGQVWLLPENDAYRPINGTDARILGIVTAVFRTYERA